MSRRPQKTAAELIAELQRNPEYVSQRAAEEDARLETERALREEQEPLIVALAGVGVEVESVWDLVNSENSYSAAIPILVEHLQQAYSSKVKEGIARALTVPAAGRAACAVLLREFRSSRDLSPHGVKFALANAVSIVADESAVGDLMELARDPREGECRAPLLVALARLGGSGVADLLQDLQEDPLIGRDARDALKKIRTQRSV